jgi:DNA invertase Pin-like site-specific DNA recombinase
MKIGYARVSTKKQDESAQISELEKAGCEKIFHERMSTKLDRPEFHKCIESLAEGDTLVITKLDRLGRTQHQVITCLHDLQTRGINVKTLDGLIDTEALGKMAPLVVGLLTGLAEVERNLINERTQASIEYRRETGGDLGGRPKAYTPEQAEMVIRLRKEGASYRTISKTMRLGLATCKRIIDAYAA